MPTISHLLLFFFLTLSTFVEPAYGQSQGNILGKLITPHSRDISSFLISVDFEMMDRHNATFQNWKEYLGPLGVVKISTIDIAKKTAAKGNELVDLGTYQGILLLQAMAEIAALERSSSYVIHGSDLFTKFGSGEIKGRGNFICYEAGGSGAAYLLYQELAPKLRSQVLEAAQRLMAYQPRSSEGLMIRPLDKEDNNDPIFIDVAFAVTPFMLYTGLACDRKDYVDYAVFETLERMNILRNHQTGLVHQARGFQAKGFITEDNWSRGNGWAALALAVLIRDLPNDHPDRSEVENVALNFFKSVLQYQNEQGLWHQEMTDTTSYVETSGSSLLLYALGIAIEQELLGRSYLVNLKKGLRGLLAYIAEDGSVSHTCIGLLAVGDGKKEDYKNRPWAYNEAHSFGAVSLAFVQAAKLGIEKIDISFKQGYLVEEVESEN